ncbi:carbonic anhydrase 9 isoform X1 [Aquarana catesbeiana]|uniref:carbonic anhydrase 9 isoform X1 n=1 Tax=Aquarana catesbeiana TaxID=8400 RepID=UPI003CCA01D3
MGLRNLWLLLLIGTFLGPLVTCDDPEDHLHEDHPPGRGHWSYTDVTEWDKAYPACGEKEQSPINVDTRDTRFDPTLKPIEVSGYDVSPEESLKLKNNGHTVVLQLPDSLEIVGGLTNTYRAAQLHFHWGSQSSPGSEHTVNGQKFPGEIHVVHYSSSFQSLDEAVTQPGGLAVLAAFIQKGPEENKDYQHLLTHLEEVKEAGESTEIPGFDIRGLLPQQLDRYYRYNGSLTTPPCYQTVNWTIFNQTIFLSEDQLDILEDTIHHDHDHILQENFREPQSLNGRLVLSSFRPPVSGRKAPEQAPAPSASAPDSANGPSDRSGEAPAPSASAPDSANGPSDRSGEGAPRADNQTFSTGDMLAIIFGVLFAVTALAFFIYFRQNRKKNLRSSDKKSNVIYKAATAEDNMA